MRALWTRTPPRSSKGISWSRLLGIPLAIACLTQGPSVALGEPAVVRSCVDAFEQTRLQAPDGAGGDQFGTSVATDGSTLLVGAWYKSEGNERPGAAYVFEREGSRWCQAGRLRGSLLGDGSWFGNAVAISGDTAVVGASETGYRPQAGEVTVVEGGEATWNRPAARRGAGAAHVFRKRNGSWEEEARLTVVDAPFEARFGSAVALEGDLLVVGAPGPLGSETVGAAYVFRRDAGSWQQVATLRPADLPEGAGFGEAVAVSDGTIAVGTSRARTVYLFHQQQSGWTEEARLTNPAPDIGKEFGSSLALRGDLLLVGAPWNDDIVELPQAAFLFRRAKGHWQLEARLSQPSADRNFNFGHSVDVQPDRAAIAAAWTLYLFRREGASWTVERTLTSQGTSFGTAFALREHLIVVGAPSWDRSEPSKDAVLLFALLPLSDKKETVP
jgi:hypothetical protein